MRALMKMRAERAERREQLGAVRLQVEQADPSGKVVFEAEAVRQVVRRPAGRPRVLDAHHPRRSRRRDRPERRRQDDAAPAAARRDSSRTRARSGAARTWRWRTTTSSASSSTRSGRVFDTIGDGNEVVTVAGRPRHVNGYLRDFLFPPERARSPVKALSGGERNRLLLARLFTRPANVLVLDEPTNDLDLETLELLEAQLVEWPGTLILVSHDRVFLDNIVTSTLVLEGDGRVGRVRGRLRGLAAGEACRRGGSPGGRDAVRRARPRRPRRGRARRERAARRRASGSPTWSSASSISCRRGSRRSRPSSSGCTRPWPRPSSTRRRRTPSRRSLSRLEALQRRTARGLRALGRTGFTPMKRRLFLSVFLLRAGADVRPELRPVPAADRAGAGARRSQPRHGGPRALAVVRRSDGAGVRPAERERGHDRGRRAPGASCSSPTGRRTAASAAWCWRGRGRPASTSPAPTSRTSDGATPP